MTDRLTDEQLAEIGGRLEAATPGPWEGVTDRDEFLTMSPLGYGRGVIIKFTDRFGCEMAQNAALIAHAPTDIRALLDEVERLRAWIKEAQIASVKAVEVIREESDDVPKNST